MDEATGSIVSTLIAQYGLPGIIIVVLGYAYHKLQQKLHSEQNARIEDAKLYAQELLAVSDRVHQTTERLVDTLEMVQRSRLFSSPDIQLPGNGRHNENK